MVQVKPVHKRATGRATGVRFAWDRRKARAGKARPVSALWRRLRAVVPVAPCRPFVGTEREQMGLWR
jgi:hypothetical protein